MLHGVRLSAIRLVKQSLPPLTGHTACRNEETWQTAWCSFHASSAANSQVPISGYASTGHAPDAAGYTADAYSQQPNSEQPWPQWEAEPQAEAGAEAGLQLPDWLPQDPGGIQYGASWCCSRVSLSCLIIL